MELNKKKLKNHDVNVTYIHAQSLSIIYIIYLLSNYLFIRYSDNSMYLYQLPFYKTTLL